MQYIFREKGKSMLKTILFPLLGCGLLLWMCENGGNESSKMSRIPTIGGVTAVMDGAGDSLVAFDIYADWCGPCRALAPTLEKVAADNKGKVTFYRINMDQVPEAGQMFGARGIPLVVFVKNKQVVASFTGIQPEDTYVQAIDKNSNALPGSEQSDKPKL